MKIAYWIATGLLSLMMLFSASMYIFNHEEILKTFISFNYPGYVIYPLAILKLSGITVILLNKWKSLKEWAYAGFFFNFVMAFFAHQQAGDGEWGGALMALVLLLASYFLGKKVRA
ncbi:DoxX family protein [Aquimarina sp. MMG016]|uniref:DoxX family protein n=1 Tax=Aquimarina sp. MMG016 TaxID=2822690 RepID=UPI001B39DA05|nr:DoxX family protein [Aquimarina sp. MMG016]MBQ4819888.1 DoxX family protein [Aquimarina sp. MMG016]